MSKFLQIKKTDLEGVLLIRPAEIFEDFRGDYIETYNKKLYHDNGIDVDFVQDDYATSFKHVLRGVHGDSKTTKLVSCIYGTLYVIIANNLHDSSEYRKWAAFTLSSLNRSQIFVPAGFGVSYLVMSNEAIFHYKQSHYYGDAKQFTIKWNDPLFKFWWPINDPITSYRDKKL